MLKMEYIIDKNKSLLTVLFDVKVLHHLKAKCDDNLILLQSLNNISRFVLIKADTGYRIRRYSPKKKMYQINISHPLAEISEFPMMDCTYFMRKNHSILIKNIFQEWII